MYDFPMSARDEKMAPNIPSVENVAIYSTKVIACKASGRCEEGTISVRTPLLAGAEPDARGSRNPTEHRLELGIKPIRPLTHLSKCANFA